MEVSARWKLKARCVLLPGVKTLHVVGNIYIADRESFYIYV